MENTEETKQSLEKVEVELIPNGDFYNINPKKQMKPGQYIEVVKTYTLPRISKDYHDHSLTDVDLLGESKYDPFGIASVSYDGVDCSFFLKGKKSNDEVKKFAETGGEGDKIRIIISTQSFVNDKTGLTISYPVMDFEKVEA